LGNAKVRLKQAAKVQEYFIYYCARCIVDAQTQGERKKTHTESRSQEVAWTVCVWGSPSSLPSSSWLLRWYWRERCFPATRKEQKNTLLLTWLILSQACCCFVVCVVVAAAAGPSPVACCCTLFLRRGKRTIYVNRNARF
jgi:hypothetical protein